MKKSMEGIQFANEKNVRVSHSKASPSPLNYPSNSAYLSPSSPHSPLTASKIDPDSRAKLIQQNKRLKQQVLQLASHMQDLVGKEREKKRYGIGLGEDEQTEMKRLEGKKIEIRILETKNEIFGLSKELDYVYDQQATIAKENAIRNLENQVKILEEERNGLLKVRKEQEKVLDQLKDGEKYTERVDKSRSQVAKLKDECKAISSKIQENEKLLLKSHEKAVGRTKKIKQIQEKIRENKQKMKKGTSNVVTVQMIADIEQEITKLERQHKETQKQWQEKIANMEIQLGNRRAEEQKKLLILREKEKEVKLNDIRLKQFKKLIIQARSQRKIEPPAEQAHPFRNKRNIKFIERQQPIP